jgi:hypothetical protein
MFEDQRVLTGCAPLSAGSSAGFGPDEELPNQSSGLTLGKLEQAVRSATLEASSSAGRSGPRISASEGVQAQLHA